MVVSNKTTPGYMRGMWWFWLIRGKIGLVFSIIFLVLGIIFSLIAIFGFIFSGFNPGFLAFLILGIPLIIIGTISYFWSRFIVKSTKKRLSEG